MFSLSEIFKKAGAELQAANIVRAVLRHRDAFVTDNDFTDQVFLTLGIGRLHHVTAKTDVLFARPEQTFKIQVLNDAENPIELPGSEAAFLTTYTSWGRKPALGLVIRDQIHGVQNARRDKHIVAAMGGVFTTPERFVPFKLIQAEFGMRGNVKTIFNLPLTQENAEKTLAAIALNLKQILDEDRLDAMGNARQIRRMSPDAVKSLTFTP
ncbi:MAG: hypothetical protein JWO78_338 [Micavibrio sp.]|nr:hypothetical protein [Micavibrio sp.]